MFEEYHALPIAPMSIRHCIHIRTIKRKEKWHTKGLLIRILHRERWSMMFFLSQRGPGAPPSG